jgi:MFS superfamily sulfate permease-like transporter
MKGPRRQWWGGLAGIVTVLSLAAASVLVRHSPSTDQPTGDVTGSFTDHRTSALLAAYLLGFGATVLLFFVSAFPRAAWPRRGPPWVGGRGLCGRVTLVAVVIIGAATLAVLAFRPDTTPAVARALYDANGLLIVFASFPAAAFLSSAL